MTVNDICSKIDAKFICGEGTKEFSGVYVGDLLSRAMSRVDADNLWITIMSNVNVIAVATLTEPAAIILAEDVTISGDVVANANENGITVLTSHLCAYEICTRIYEMLSESGI